MGRRLTRGGGWTASLGLVALVGALIRMGTLIEPSPEGTDWKWLLLGSFVLGVAVAAAAKLVRLNVFVASAAALAVVLVVLGRVIDPDSMLVGLVPTDVTLERIAADLGLGLDFLRFAHAPMYPYPEFLHLLLPVFIGIGFAWAWLAFSGNGAVAAVVPAGLYLGVAIADQETSSTWWLLLSVAWVGGVLVVSGLEETNRLPRLLGKPGNRGAMAAGATIVALGLVITFFATDAIPHGGAVPWRSGSGFGAGGGFALNPYASIIQTNLEDENREEIVFVAAVSSPDIPADQLSWQLATLESYDGTEWGPSVTGVDGLGDTEVIGSADHAFRLTTAPVIARVAIDGLRQELLPLPPGATDVESDSLLIRNAHVDPTGELWLDSPSRHNLQYTVTAEVPNPTLGELANASGELSPLFSSAQEAGDLAVLGSGSGDLSRPDDLARYVSLPGGIDVRIGNLARFVTGGARTDLERLVMLEEYFRDEGRFVYTTDIDPGHSAADLAAWLAEPDSDNYRQGYCEQFATAMGVMARSLGIPTRLVLGFTPGEFNEDGNIVVRGSNAHSWVEAWVNGAGWVKFDPTPRGEGDNPATAAALPNDPSSYVQASALSSFPDASPIIFNPDTGLPIDPRAEGFEDEAPTPDALDGEGVDDAASEPFVIPGWLWWVASAVLAACAIPIAKWLRRRRRLALARSGDVSAAWAEITDRLRDLDRAVDRGMTPDEIAKANLPELVPLAAAHAKVEWGASHPDERETRRAMKSFDAAEDTLARTVPRIRKLAAAWRPKSLKRP